MTAALLALSVLGQAPAFAQDDDDPPKPKLPEGEIAVLFHSKAQGKQPTMRFGIIIPRLNEPRNKGTGKKQLTFHPVGLTSNTCVRIDGEERLLGNAPGRWRVLEGKLGNGPDGKPRVGARSVYNYEDEKVEITQTVEVVKGEQTGKVDTCRVTYLIENKDEEDHSVGLRFLLDTLIGGNDGAPFVVPGQGKLCETMMDFKTADKVPTFTQAIERPNLKSPGVVAHLKLKLGGGVEPPGRVSLCAWPDQGTKAPGARSQDTMWNVPITSIKALNDSAAVIYWNEKKIPAGGKRLVGFSYGLGNFASDEDGKVAMILYGTFKAGDDLTVLALANGPKDGDSISLKLSKDFAKVKGELTQDLTDPPEGGSPLVPVTWTVRADKEGVFPITVEWRGATLRQGVRINPAAGEAPKTKDKDKDIDE